MPRPGGDHLGDDNRPSVGGGIPGRYQPGVVGYVREKETEMRKRRKRSHLTLEEPAWDAVEACDACAFADESPAPSTHKGGSMAARKRKRAFLGLDLDAIPGLGSIIDMDRIKQGAIIGTVAAGSTVAVGALLDKVAAKQEETTRLMIGVGIGMVGSGLVYSATKRADLATAFLVGPIYALVQGQLAKLIKKGAATTAGLDAYDLVAVEPRATAWAFGQVPGGPPLVSKTPPIEGYGLIAPETKSSPWGLIASEPQRQTSFVGTF